MTQITLARTSIYEGEVSLQNQNFYNYWLRNHIHSF